MERVYVLEDNAYLRKSGQNLVLFKDKKPVEEIPLADLEQLVIAGYTALSGAVLNTLIQKRVETVLLDSSFRFKARLNLEEHKHVQRRIDQYCRLTQEDFALSTAKKIVLAKLQHQARHLYIKGSRMNYQSLLAWSAAVSALARYLPSADTLDKVRGIEGFGSKLYYQAFAHLITNKDFEFKGRNKRPPLDPVNAMLSFCYTLLTNEVLTAIKISGLDPYLGALHEIAYGRLSLACDLVEEWRVFLGDRLILGLINRGSVSPDDFVYRETVRNNYIDEQEMRESRPVEMKPLLRKAFLKSYEKWMEQRVQDSFAKDKTSHRQLIYRQAKRFKAYLSGNDDYEPFPWHKMR